MLLPETGSFEELHRRFIWRYPADFNIATACCDDWAARDPGRICLEDFDPNGAHRRLSYGELATRSRRFAGALAHHGVRPGDRVALLLPQGFETVIAHIAIYRLGAIAVPLALLFGPEALSYRLQACSARAIVTNAFGLARLGAEARSVVSDGLVIAVGVKAEGVLDFDGLIAGHDPVEGAAVGGADDPALMIFTSGTTGPAKGALHGQRVLAGHIPGFQLVHGFAPQDGDRMWTPSDWAWAGGLLNALLPALMLGIPVVASPAQKFDAETAFRIMAEMRVRNAFIPPTALRLMKSVAAPRERFDLVLRSIGSAGEALGRETFEWVREALGIVPNEFYGQTECNFVLASAAHLGISRAGSIGRPVPGHRVAIIDEAGCELPSGALGQIAVKSPDPVMFLGYWQDADATDRKFRGDWLLTGDLGTADEQGYIRFFGRDDDVITSSGYRIGPAEIEDCLSGHPAVALAAAIGKPDPLRTEIVKVFIVLKPGRDPCDDLAVEIADWVKQRLSMHEYPREVVFVDSLPLTTSGKVMRRLLREREAG